MTKKIKECKHYHPQNSLYKDGNGGCNRFNGDMHIFTLYSSLYYCKYLYINILIYINIIYIYIYINIIYILI